MKEINGVIREDIIVTDSDDGLKLGSEVRFEGGVIRYTGIGTLNVYGGGVIDNEDDVNDGITYGEGGTNIIAGDTYYYEERGTKVSYIVYELYDVGRKIGKRLGGCSVTLAEDKSIVNIHISDTYNDKHENRMLLISRSYNSIQQFALVPLCGATTLTDCDEGGINGYKWYTEQTVTAIYRPSYSVKTHGHNVECAGDSLPTGDNWIDGDIVWCTVDGVLTRNEYRDGKWYRITPTVVG